MPVYSEPLCKKCLHLDSLHTEVVAKLQDGSEMRRCTVSICTCLVTWRQQMEKEKETKASQTE